MLYRDQDRDVICITCGYRESRATVADLLHEIGQWADEQPAPHKRHNRPGLAGEVIRALLADGPVSSAEMNEAFYERGISKRAAEEWRKRLGVQAVKIDGVWHWSLPAVRQTA